jgi:hypothetical protein
MTPRTVLKVLTCFYDNLDVSDPTDPEVIIKIDVANEFNSIVTQPWTSLVDMSRGTMSVSLR